MLGLIIQNELVFQQALSRILLLKTGLQPLFLL